MPVIPRAGMPAMFAGAGNTSITICELVEKGRPKLHTTPFPPALTGFPLQKGGIVNEPPVAFA